MVQSRLWCRAVFACAVAAAMPVHAQFGGLGSLLGGARALAQDGGGDAGAFLQQAFLLEVTVTKANLAIVAAYAAEDDRAKYQAQFQALSALTDPKEAGAKVQEIRESTESDLKRLSASADLAQRTKDLSEEKQQQVSKGVGNILWAGVQVVPLVVNGKLIVARVKSNPLELLNMLPVASALEKLVNTGVLAASVIGKFVDVLKGADVAVADANSVSSAENIDQI